MSDINYKKAGAYYLVGNLFNKGIVFLTVPIFTRILSTADYGIITTYNSWISILSMVIGFALHMGIRAAFIDFRDKIDDFMSVTTTFTIESGLILTAFVILGYNLIDIHISIFLLVLCMLQGISVALIQNYSMYLMMEYKYRDRTALMVFPSLISTCLSIIVILFVLRSNLYMGRIIPTAFVNICFGVWVIVLIYNKNKCRHNREYLKYSLGISAPLVLHGIALNILSQSDRTMITWLADSSQTGIYSLIYNFGMLATVITTSLEGIWTPWFMKKYQANKLQDINKLVIDYVHLMTYSMVGLVLIGPEIVKLLASEKYWEGIAIIPPVVLANYIIFLYTLYVNIEHFHKKTSYITVNTLIAASTNLVLNYLLIPKYGYVAAAYTTLISYFVAFVLHARYAKKLASNLYPIKIFIPSLIQITLTIAIFYLLIDYGFARWLIAFIYIGSMLFVNRKRIGVFFPSLKNKLKKNRLDEYKIS